MEGITLFDLGATHALLVDAALRALPKIGPADLSRLPKLRRDAVVLQWLAREVRWNGFENFFPNGHEPLLPTLHAALFSIGTETSTQMSRLISEGLDLYMEELLTSVEASSAAISPERDTSDEPPAADAPEVSLSDEVNGLLDQLLREAEDYFKREVASETAATHSA